MAGGVELEGLSVVAGGAARGMAGGGAGEVAELEVLLEPQSTNLICLARVPSCSQPQAKGPPPRTADNRELQEQETRRNLNRAEPNRL